MISNQQIESILNSIKFVKVNDKTIYHCFSYIKPINFNNTFQQKFLNYFETSNNLKFKNLSKKSIIPKIVLKRIIQQKKNEAKLIIDNYRDKLSKDDLLYINKLIYDKCNSWLFDHYEIWINIADNIIKFREIAFSKQQDYNKELVESKLLKWLDYKTTDLDPTNNSYVLSKLQHVMQYFKYTNPYNVSILSRLYITWKKACNVNARFLNDNKPSVLNEKKLLIKSKKLMMDFSKIITQKKVIDCLSKYYVKWLTKNIKKLKKYLCKMIAKPFIKYFNITNVFDYKTIVQELIINTWQVLNQTYKTYDLFGYNKIKINILNNSCINILKNFLKKSLIYLSYYLNVFFKTDNDLSFDASNIINNDLDKLIFVWKKTTLSLSNWLILCFNVKKYSYLLYKYNWLMIYINYSNNINYEKIYILSEIFQIKFINLMQKIVLNREKKKYKKLSLQAKLKRKLKYKQRLLLFKKIRKIARNYIISVTRTSSLPVNLQINDKLVHNHLTYKRGIISLKKDERNIQNLFKTKKKKLIYKWYSKINFHINKAIMSENLHWNIKKILTTPKNSNIFLANQKLFKQYIYVKNILELKKINKKIKKLVKVHPTYNTLYGIKTYIKPLNHSQKLLTPITNIWKQMKIL